MASPPIRDLTGHMTSSSSVQPNPSPAGAPRSLAKVLLRIVPAAILIGGVTTASAASLGLSPSGFASGSAAVTGCDSSLSISYTTVYDDTSGKYQVTQAVVKDIDDEACAGQILDIVVADEDFTSLATGSATVNAPTMTVTLSDPVDAEAIRNVAVVISE